MGNWDDGAAQAFHEATKHSYESIRRSRHFLDWSNRPHPFKEHLSVEAIPLPAVEARPDVGTLDVLAPTARDATAALTLVELARVLGLGAGVVRRRRLPGGEEYHFRTYSSAGALYPVEVYVAGGALPELPPGLYHFHPRDHSLRTLRTRDVRPLLAAAADAEWLAEAGAVLVLTGILWRTAWKYQARGYRHLYWDAGTMLANLLALASAAGLGPRLLTGFVDEEVNRVVGVDGEHEAALALLALGRGAPAHEPGELEPLKLDVAPLSRQQVDYPQAHALHADSALHDAEEVRRYRTHTPDAGEPTASRNEIPDQPLERVLRRRGSIRDFSPKPVPAEWLAAILARAVAPVPADFQPCNDLYLIANAIDGIAPGAYRFQPPERFELLREGDFRRQAAHLLLEQPFGGLSAATVFLMADLEAVTGRLGNRGYGAAQLEAGIFAGRIYLGAFALGLGATASTFYDDDVTDFFAPGTSLAPMLAVALGNRRRKSEYSRRGER